MDTQQRVFIILCIFFPHDCCSLILTIFKILLILQFLINFDCYFYYEINHYLVYCCYYIYCEIIGLTNMNCAYLITKKINLCDPQVNLKPGRDTIPLSGGNFKRDIYMEAAKKRALHRVAANIKPGQQQSSSICSIMWPISTSCDLLSIIVSIDIR